MNEDGDAWPDAPVGRFLETSTSVVALIVDAAGTIRQANAYAEGLVGEALVGRPWHALALNFGREPLLAEWLAQAARPRLLNVRTASGLPQTLEVHVEPWNDQLLLIGEVNAAEQTQLRRALLELTQDLSNLSRELALRNDELERAQSQLLQSDRLASIGVLAAGLAHEINNPVAFVRSNLGSLGGYLEDLLRYTSACETALQLPTGRAPQTAALGALRSALDLALIHEDTPVLLAESRAGLDRVTRIVTALRQFARIDTVEEGWSAEDLHQGLENTLIVVQPQFGPRCEVLRAFATLPPVPCRLSQLNQVFMNLLLNAAQACGAEGCITVRTGATAQEAWVEVQDTGPGIAPAHLGRLFDPFFTTKPPGQGTGLGLSLAHHIVQQHHGRIEVDSAPGQGARFRVWLPLRQPGVAISSASSAAASR